MKIYFVHQGFLSFVKKDLKILKQKHQVKAVNNFNSTLSKIPENFLGVLWCDVVFCWFGGPRFIAPIMFGRLFRKKVVIVAGGYDVVRLPEIGYGNMRGGLIAWVQRKLFRFVHNIICISESNRKEAIHNADISAEKITMIYHGFYPPKKSKKEKEHIVITVGRLSKRNLLRKGLWSFIETAKFFPDIPFFMIGSVDDGIKERLKNVLPPNLTLTGYVSDKELEDYFSRSKVYVQASTHEGFGCSVAEAMLYECVPVVSDCFALPEVVGDAGFLVKTGDLEDLKEKIALALRDRGELGRKASQRIRRKFSLEARLSALLNLIESL